MSDGLARYTLISDAVREQLGTAMLTIPAPLHAIARRVGVGAVLNGDSALGCVDLSSPRPTVWLAAGMGANRRRFTLAHELGHIVTHRQPERFRTAPGTTDVERMCDRIAAELLLPLPWMRPLVHRTWTLTELEEFALIAQVSVAALVNRLSDLGGATVWMRAQKARSPTYAVYTNDWCVTERAGAKGIFRHTVDIAPDSCNSLTDLDNGMHTRTIRLQTPTKSVTLEATLRKRDGDVWLAARRTHDAGTSKWR